MKLKNKTWATKIHEITGKPTEDGYLEAGCSRDYQAGCTEERKRGARVTTCGTIRRAVVIAQDGNKLTYRWPCGFERTETLMAGPRGMRRPASEWQVRFFARYWADGVSYECPKCRRAALKKEREVQE